MQAHTLTLKKDFTNTTDASTPFTLQVLFDFDYDGDEHFDTYIAYPLYYTVDGQSQYVDGSGNKVPYQLSGTGTLTIKAGQVIEIEEIPQNAKIKLVEVLNDTVSGYRYDSIALTKNGVPATSTKVTKGIEFTMGNEDMMAVVSNKKPDNKYTITYKYPSYGASPKTNSLYGDQSYTVSGVFTEKEMQTYLQLNTSSGKLEFQSNALKKTFINNKAPYEDNFMQNLSFASSTVDETGGGWVDGDYSCSVTATGTADYSINAYFNLPYNVDQYLVPQASDGRVAYKEAVAVGEKSITCFDWYVTAGKTNKRATGDDPVFVNAPLIIYDGNTPMYFQYWSVKSQSGYGKQSAEYTRCYDYEFNYALFMDCIIEPVYDIKWAQPAQGGPTAYNDYKHFNPELQVKGDTSNEISIAFLENSRNQYNNNGGGGRIGGEAADVVYSDFLLNFNYNKDDGLVQLNKLEAGQKAAGLVIEAVKYMDKEEDNPTAFDYDKNYSGVEEFNNNETTQKAAIVNWLQGGTQPTGCKKAQFDVKELDNKNCRQYFTSLNNRMNSDGQLLNTLQNRYKVFRAYAYIGDGASNGNLSNVTLSKPVYFTIYDVGSQGLDDNATNN